MENGPHIILEDLALKLSDDGKFLQADFSPSGDRKPINLAWLKEQLAAHRLDTYKLNNDAIGIFLKEYNEGKNASTINIGEKVDGEFHLKLSGDLLSARLIISPAQGGQPVTKQLIMDEIQALGINTGLNETEIDSALQSAETQDALIAQGQKPEHGKDGYFESLIPKVKDRRPRIDKHGIAHYHDIGDLVLVKPGDAIVRRFPATQGVPGINIKGQEIPAIPGEEMMFAPNLIGTQIDENDPNLLIASVAGQPILVEHGAFVEQTVTVDNVDYTSGNIKFDGTVVVKGDVTTGFKIRTTGDVYVHGMVEEACLIEAGGDIVINQGVIGRGSIKEENGLPGNGIAQLRAKGNISAKFLENCLAQAGKQITVSELVAHSHISAKQQVSVGKKGSRRGQIMGGVTQADLLVQAQIIGTKGGNHTKIEVGSICKYEKRISDIEDLIKTKFVERTNLEKVHSQAANALKNNKEEKPPFLQKLQQTLDRLSMEISKLNHQKTACEQCMEKLTSAKIQVNKQVLSAVDFSICDVARKFNLEHVGGTFTFDSKEYKVQFHP